MFTITRVVPDSAQSFEDTLAVEEPLEIRVVFGPREKRRSKSLSITMRTPGSDFELAAGFLLSENIIQRPDQILSIEHVGPPPEGGHHGNTVSVELDFDLPFEIERLQRHFYTTSSCGICGRASLEAVRNQGAEPLTDDVIFDQEVIFGLSKQLRQRQNVFEQTGGIHAAGLVSPSGELVAIQEDVGRHNAVDKLIGSQLLNSESPFPLANHLIAVSGRASFELLQKSLMAGIPILVAVGAPSSLAVELADAYGMTLVGFASEQRFNIYTGNDRIRSN